MMFSWSTNEGMKYIKFQFQLCGVHELFPRKHFWAIHISRLGFAFARVILLYDYKFLLSVAWWCICTIKKTNVKPTSDFLIPTLGQMKYCGVEAIQISRILIIIYFIDIIFSSYLYKTKFLVFDHNAITTIFSLVATFICHWYRQIVTAQKCLR